MPGEGAKDSVGVTLQNKNHLKDLCMPHYLETGKGLACYQVNFRPGQREEASQKREGGRWREVREEGRGEKEEGDGKEEGERQGGEEGMREEQRRGSRKIGEEGGMRKGVGIGEGESLLTLQTTISGLQVSAEGSCQPWLFTDRTTGLQYRKLRKALGTFPLSRSVR